MSTLELPERTACEELSFSWTRVVSEAVIGCQLMVCEVRICFDKLRYGRGKESGVLWFAERG